jgi:RIO-like serine/threonine protein kinase
MGNQIAVSHKGISASPIISDASILSPVRHVNRYLRADGEVNKLIQSQVNVGKQKYNISKFISRREEGSVYEGYDEEDVTKTPVIVKFFEKVKFKMGYLNNEERALKRQSRLIKSDRRRYILVSKKINGSSLDTTILTLIQKKEFKKCTSLLKKYVGLPSDFRQKYKLVHGEAEPSNVIVDDDGELHLINFGSTVPISKVISTAKEQFLSDDFVATHWAEYYMGLLANELVELKKELLKDPNNFYL